MTINAKSIAEQVVLNCTDDIDFMGVGEFMEGEDGVDALSEDEFDALHREVADLASKAHVTVTWTDDPEGLRQAAAELVKLAQKAEQGGGI